MIEFPVVTIGVLPERVTQEFLIRQGDAVNLNIVDGYASWGFKAEGACGSDNIVLVNSVTANPQTANESSGFI